MRDLNATLSSRDWAPLFAAFGEVLEWLLDRAQLFAREYPEEVAAVERIRVFIRQRAGGFPAHARMDDLLFTFGLVAGAIEQQRQRDRAAAAAARVARAELAQSHESRAKSVASVPRVATGSSPIDAATGSSPIDAATGSSPMDVAEVAAMRLDFDSARGDVYVEASRLDLDAWRLEPASGDDDAGATRIEAVPSHIEAVPPRIEAVPSRNEAAQSRIEAVPSRNEAVPSRNEAIPSQIEAVPSRNEAVPSRNEAVPPRIEAVPSRIEPEAASRIDVDPPSSIETSEPSPADWVDAPPPAHPRVFPRGTTRMPTKRAPRPGASPAVRVRRPS